MKKSIILLALFSTAIFAQQRGSFKDPRDGKTYKTVKIGEQVWMAENLDYAGKNRDLGACYDKKPENCRKYGALYDWNDAMKACPSGWHLPSDDEWGVLIDFAGENAGKKLKAKVDWNNYKNQRGETLSGNGTDNYGFSALPGGFGYSRGGFANAASSGSWWSSSGGYYWMVYDKANVLQGPDDKSHLNSVRCLKGSRSEKSEIYYKNGKLQSVGNLKEGKQDGIWKSYYESGELQFVANFKESKKDGKVEGYYESGKLQSVVNFKDDKLNGKWEIYYESGKLQSVVNYKNDKQDGKMETYYESGQLKEVGNFKDDKVNGKVETYYESGQLETVVNFKDGKANGKAESYYENGKLQTVENYKNNKKDGKMEIYYESGKLQAVMNYKDDKLNGKAEIHDEDGKLQVVENYKDGKKEGKRESYHKSGQLETVANLKDGKLNGKWESYYESGQLKEVGNFKEGKQGGKWEIYDEDGTLAKTEYYEDIGKIVKIGEQTWMAENLNYDVIGSKCYDDNEENCQKYGRLYDWETAMKACPKGWHLPSNKEWDKLYRYADGTNGTESPYESETADKFLKAKEGWNDYEGESGNGEDKFGFSALPGGRGDSGGDFYDVGGYGYWWSSSENGSGYAYPRLMYYNLEYAFYGNYDKSYLYSVRCVKD
jgi:uncharacterized protein (TIGR02145 family)